jgi:4-amino-4-deoxy-L-arabinose transferase-like glycosyltransferase
VTASRPTLDRRHAALLGVIVLGGTLLRLHYLNLPMRYDEAYTFDAYAVDGVGHITSTYDIPNNHIFYSLLAHFSWRVFGNHVWTMRLPAFAAGIALIPAAYLVGRTLYDRRAGLCAAVLVATFGPLVEYSVNGRGYTFGALLVLVALWLGARLLVTDRRAPLWVAFVVCSTVAVYTVPTMAYGIAAVAVWVAMCALISERRTRLVVELGVACFAAAGLSVLLYSAVLGQPGWTAVQPVPVAWSPIWHLVTAVWAHWNSDAPHPVDWIVAACFCVATAVHRRIARHPVPLVLPVAIAVVAIIAVGELPPYPRNWLFLLPLYLIPAGAGLSWLASRVRALPEGAVAAAATASLAIVLALATLNSGLRNTDTPPTSDNDIVDLLRRYVPPGQKAVIDPVFVAVPTQYYFRQFGGSELATTRIGPAQRRAGRVILVVARDITAEQALRFFGARPTGPARRLVHRYVSIYDVPIAPAAAGSGRRPG